MHPRSIAALGAASLGWGLAGVGVRALFIAGATTFTVVAFRIQFATVAIVGYGLVGQTVIDGEAWRRGSAIGVLRIGIAPMLFIGSLNFVSAGFEALVITLVPVVTAVMARLLLSETLRRTRVFGLLFGLTGTLITVSGSATNTTPPIKPAKAWNVSNASRALIAAGRRAFGVSTCEQRFERL
jgi:drug/metabolite transporter (DMT)-like permease